MHRIPSRSTLIGVGVAVVLGVAACSDRPSSSDSRGAGDTVMTAASDTVVTSMVKARLAGEGAVPSSDIQVTTNDGVVTLEGTVPSEQARTTAESVVRSTQGVARVVNHLVVSSDPDRVAEASRIASDAWITTKVKSMLLADSVSQGLEITVHTSDGVVVLAGSMDHQSMVDHITEIAERVDGVRAVDTTRVVVATGN